MFTRRRRRLRRPGLPRGRQTTSGKLASPPRNHYDAPVKLARQTIHKSSLRNHADDNFVPGGIAKRLLMVWPMTREVAALSPHHDVEQRLQRDVVRVTRRRR